MRQVLPPRPLVAPASLTPRPLAPLCLAANTKPTTKLFGAMAALFAANGVWFANTTERHSKSLEEDNMRVREEARMVREQAEARRDRWQAELGHRVQLSDKKDKNRREAAEGAAAAAVARGQRKAPVEVRGPPLGSDARA